MEAVQRQLPLLGKAFEDERLATVMRKGGLSGEAKWAWLFLWMKAGFHLPAKDWIHVGAVGEFQGTSDASGRRSLKALEAQGPLLLIHDREHGRWYIELLDPLPTVKAARPSEDDVQQVLFEETVAPPPVPEDPAAVPFPGITARDPFPCDGGGRPSA